MLVLGSQLTAEPRATPYGIKKRVPWTTSRVVGSPDPPAPFSVELAFPHLEFERPTAIARAAGTDWLFIADRKGKVFAFPNDRETRDAGLVLDVERDIYGMAFHPDFAKNGYFYLFLTLKKPSPNRTRIARFTVTDREPFRADLDSHFIILEFPSDGHDGGCLRFGPDGYLYIGTGDGGGANDQHSTGQYLGDFLSSILRIDVNGTHHAKPYGIPPDNPFLNTPGAKPEVFAYGFRQVWQMTFDRETGDLWVGDVGQDLWEMVYLVEPGGNYGWSIMEGPQPFRPQRPHGPTPILPPIVSHSHDESRSVTGGYVYRGSRLKNLIGAYVYADYRTGKLWGMRYDGNEATVEELADTALDIAAFGEDHDGELYLLTHEEGRIHRLMDAPSTHNTSKKFPRLLSETGLFTSVADHSPAPGVIPYSVNSPLWSDYAHKERFLAIPGDARIQYGDSNWRLPEGSVLVKTFSLEMERNNPASRRRLETRILTVEDRHWRGYTYLWNDAQTDAELLGKKSLRKTYTIRDAAAPGGKREQTWHYPSRSDCIVCHNGSFTLIGMRNEQMNRDHDYGGVVDNQIRTLNHLGLFDKPLSARYADLRKMPDPRDESQPLELRARSYLHANCANCHRYKGGGNSDFKLTYKLPLAETDTLNVRPLHGTLGVDDAKLLMPGDPERSLIYRRMAQLGPGHMPHVGTLELDRFGIELVRRWIESLE